MYIRVYFAFKILYDRKKKQHVFSFPFGRLQAGIVTDWVMERRASRGVGEGRPVYLVSIYS